MKYFAKFLILLIILSSNSTFAINGGKVIYDSEQYGIRAFYNFPQSSGRKVIYIQNGLTGDNSYGSPVGRVYKLNSNLDAVYVPHNSFLTTHWFTSMFPPHYTSICAVPCFAVSYHDTNVVMNYRYSCGADCPDARAFMTNNNGVSNSFLPFGCGGFFLYPKGIELSAENPNTFYFVFNTIYSSRNGVYKSTDAGNNWSIIDTLPNLPIRDYSFDNNFMTQEGRGGYLKINRNNPSIHFLAGTERTLISTQSGQNFYELNIPYLKDMDFHSFQNTVVGISGNKLYKSNDNGLSWDSIFQQREFNDIEINPDNPQIIYAGANDGLYKSFDGGATFVLYNNTFVLSKKVIGISKSAGMGDSLYVATDKSLYKVWASSLVGFEQVSSIIPSSFELKQNYPNPFNPVTNIEFSVPNSQIVKLMVFNSLGKEVAVVLNQQMSPGVYKVQWNSGMHSSGIYFYKLIFNSGAITKKMLLIK